MGRSIWIMPMRSAAGMPSLESRRTDVYQVEEKVSKNF